MAKNPRETKRYKKLLASLEGNEAAAVAAWNAHNPDRRITDPSTTQSFTSKEQADVLVAQAGLVHARGRVYSNVALIEAQVRVLKTGKPEVVRLDGDRHTKGVVLFRLDDGQSVAMQNLAEPS